MESRCSWKLLTPDRVRPSGPYRRTGGHEILRPTGRVRKLLDGGRAWIKVSGAYIDSKDGPPDYPDSSAVAKSYIAAAPGALPVGEQLAGCRM